MTTVLVVDDSTANRRLLHTLLSLKGHEVIEADSDDHALAIVREEPTPTIVVADLFTPRAGGTELVRGLRENPRTAGIPVVAYGFTGEREAGSVAREYRVDRVVAGTSDPGPLLEAIDSLIGNGTGSGSGAGRSPAPGPARPPGQGPPHGEPAPGPQPERGQQPTQGRQPTQDWQPAQGQRPARGRQPAREERPAQGRRPGGQPIEEPATDAGPPRTGRHPFAQVVESAPVGIVIGDATGNADYVNPALSRITGIPAEGLLGTGWLSCLSADRHRQVLDAASGATVPAGQEALRYRDRVHRPGREPQVLDVHLFRTAGGTGTAGGTVRAAGGGDAGPPPGGFAAYVVDVSDTVRTEERRLAEWERHVRDDTERATTRMESLRRFAGSVAHGYNNALAVILAYGDFLRDRITEAHGRGRIDPATAHDLQADLTSVLDAGRRAAHLTQQLQSFGHRGRPPAPTATVDLNACLKPEVTALRQRLDPSVTLRATLDEGLPPVVADGEQIGEIVRNLAENALDAMPNGGELHIETAPGDPAMGTELLASDGHVRLTIRDTGEGMPPNVTQHAIEPFFSTKPDSPGGGLGLTAVYGIARQAGGDMVIESVAGGGTSVHVLFPVATPTGEAPPGAELGTSDITETILVVDDEEPVRRLVHRILTKAGYQVLTAQDAVEALDVARANPGPVHCLITDLAMPGLPGTELTRRLRAQRPELAVLYMSGYAEPLLHHVGNADNRTNLLPKPFSRAELLTTLRATIHEHRAHRGR